MAQPKEAAPIAQAIEEHRRSGLSWAKVAEALGLKGPGAARKAYTDATGKSHNDIEGVAVKVARAPRAPGAPKPAPKVKADRNPHWNVDSDQDEMIKVLEPVWEQRPNGSRELKEAARITIHRVCANAGGYVLEDEFVVERLLGFKFDKDERNLLVEFHDNVSGGYHCIRVQDIVEVVR